VSGVSSIVVAAVVVMFSSCIRHSDEGERTTRTYAFRVAPSRRCGILLRHRGAAIEGAAGRRPREPLMNPRGSSSPIKRAPDLLPGASPLRFQTVK
jgi:hypothetical protein